MNAAASNAVAVPVPGATPTDAEITAQFESLYPELLSRATAISRAVARNHVDQDEAAAEVLAHAWINFRSAAMRGKWLPAAQLAWVAWGAARQGRPAAGGSSITDVLDPRAHRMGRARVVRLQPWSGSRRRQRVRFVPARMASSRRLGRSLTTQEWQSPAERARVRIDWTAFAGSLSQRHAAILCGIAEGWQGKEIADGLGVSPGRIVQQKCDIASKIVEFFGPDVIP